MEYAEAFPLSRLKEEETFKEPYSDAEMQKLLRKPKESCWVEWRNPFIEKPQNGSTDNK